MNKLAAQLKASQARCLALDAAQGGAAAKHQRKINKLENKLRTKDVKITALSHMYNEQLRQADALRARHQKMDIEHAAQIAQLEQQLHHPIVATAAAELLTPCAGCERVQARLDEAMQQLQSEAHKVGNLVTANKQLLVDRDANVELTGQVQALTAANKRYAATKKKLANDLSATKEQLVEALWQRNLGGLPPDAQESELESNEYRQVILQLESKCDDLTTQLARANTTPPVIHVIGGNDEGDIMYLRDTVASHETQMQQIFDSMQNVELYACRLSAIADDLSTKFDTATKSSTTRNLDQLVLVSRKLLASLDALQIAPP